MLARSKTQSYSVVGKRIPMGVGRHCRDFDSTLVPWLMFVECDCRSTLRVCVCSLSGCLLL